MLVTVNYRDPRPIYEQIKSTLQQMIASGAYSSDTKLPSVRELASRLAINPNTIQRAYKELEESGYIVSVPGKGSYVGDSSQLKSKFIQQLYAEFDSVALRLLSLDIPASELSDRIFSVSKGVNSNQ